MTRTEAIEKITSNVSQLDDEQLAALADYTAWLAVPSVYSALPPVEKAALDAALDDLDRGAGVPWSTVKDELDTMLKAAGV